MSEATGICIVGPVPPPFGGMAVQTEKLTKLLQKEGLFVVCVPTNPALPGIFSRAEKVPLVRTILRTCVFLVQLTRALCRTRLVYFLSGFLNFFLWVTLPAIALAFLMKKPFILNGRGGGAPVFFRRWGRLLGPVIRRLALVTVPSGFLQQVFRERCRVTPVMIPNIADLDQFPFKKRKCAAPRFVVARNLEPYYNVACAVAAFAGVRKVHPGAELGIAGCGSLENEIRAQVETLGISDAVCFHGQVPHDRMPELYEQYDIMLNSSNVDNLPGVILEAFASGLPVVTTDAGGIPFLVTHGVSGLMVKKNDPAALADCCLELLETPGLAETLVENGRRVCRMYTWDHIRTLLLPCLENLGENGTKGGKICT